jgi:hypothetical protein
MGKQRPRPRGRIWFLSEALLQFRFAAWGGGGEGRLTASPTSRSRSWTDAVDRCVRPDPGAPGGVWEPGRSGKSGVVGAAPLCKSTHVALTEPEEQHPAAPDFVDRHATQRSPSVWELYCLSPKGGQGSVTILFSAPRAIPGTQRRTVKYWFLHLTGVC